MTALTTGTMFDTDRLLPGVAWDDPEVANGLLDAAIECGVVTVANNDGKEIYRYGGDRLGVGRKNVINSLIADEMVEVLYYAIQPADEQPVGLCADNDEVGDKATRTDTLVEIGETETVDAIPCDDQNGTGEALSASGAVVADDEVADLFVELIDDLVSPDGKKRRREMASEMGARLTLLESKARQESQLDNVVAEINTNMQTARDEDRIKSLENNLAESIQTASRHERKRAELMAEAEHNNTLAEQAELATLKDMASSYREVSGGLQVQANQSLGILENAKSQVETLSNDLEAYQSEADAAVAAISEEGEVKMRAAQESYDKILLGLKQDDKGAALYAQVMDRLEQRRHVDFMKLSRMIGVQANKDIIKRAEMLDLGSYVENLKLLTSDRGRWISDITPDARRFCEELASGNDMQALRATGGEGVVGVHPRAKFVVLRAEKIAVVDANGWELTRIDFGPDANPYFRSTVGRKWTIGNTDVWPLN